MAVETGCEAGSGIMGMLVHAAKQDVVVPGKHFLGAVAMMDIEVHDQDFADVVGMLQVARSHGDVVEQAEAHGSGVSRMMPRRPHRAERRCVFSRKNVIDSGYNSSGGVEGRFERFLRNRRIGRVEVLRSLRAGLADPLDVPGVMDVREFLYGSAPRLHPLEQAGITVFTKRLHNHRYPRRTFRVPDAGVMFKKYIMIENSGHTAPPSACIFCTYRNTIIIKYNISDRDSRVKRESTTDEHG